VTSRQNISERGGLPLPTLLSQVWVAFTIEFDNEFEHQAPHSTSRHGSTGGPWLVSAAMWWTCMRFITEQGITARELARLARTKTNLNGMQRWGYITVRPDPSDERPKSPASAWLIRPTPKGRMAQQIWRPLLGVVEERWRSCFGAAQIDRLQDSLRALVSSIDLTLPDCLPILGYGLVSRAPDQAGSNEDDLQSLPLVALLARALLVFAIEFERESALSLAVSANVVRVLDENGVRVRDLPLLSGVSKEAIAMALGFLQKRGVAVVEEESGATRAKIARLTPKGRDAQDAHRNLLGANEQRWQARFGKDTISEMRDCLTQLVGGATASSSPLFRGLEPYPDGWRAKVPKPKTLPHFPMVLHRGGYPDGS